MVNDNAHLFRDIPEEGFKDCECSKHSSCDTCPYQYDDVACEQSDSNDTRDPYTVMLDDLIAVHSRMEGMCEDTDNKDTFYKLTCLALRIDSICDDLKEMR